MERLSWDHFLTGEDARIKEMMEAESDDKQIAINLCTMCSKFVDNECDHGINEHMKYMCNFIMFASKFRDFYSAIRAGDRTMQEFIMCEFLGVFYVKKKHKYFEITLLQIEREYKHASYKELQEIRMNVAFRHNDKCKLSHKADEHSTALKVLDEVQENVNFCCKRLPLGVTSESWLQHSPNLMCAMQSINFEKEEYAHHRINYETIGTNDHNSYHYVHKNTTEPRKNVERIRLHEFIVKAFDNKGPCSEIDEEDFQNIYDNLETKLNVKDVEDPNKNDELGDCIEDLFKDMKANDAIDDDSILDEIEGNEVRTSNDTGIDVEFREEDIDRDSVEDTTKRNAFIDKNATINLIKKGKEELAKIDLGEVRMRIKTRNERFQSR